MPVASWSIGRWDRMIVDTVGKDGYSGKPEVGAWLLAEPADDGDAAVIAVVVDEVLTF